MVRASTTVSHHGAYVIVVSTTLGDLVVELHSTYTGHPRCDTQISELRLAGRGGGRYSLARTATPDELPVIAKRRDCFYDHLQRLQELTLEAGAVDVRIDVLDAALSRV